MNSTTNGTSPKHSPVEIGQTFYFETDKSPKPHLYFVIAGPDSNDVFMLVNISTRKPYKSDTCIIQPGDHPYITQTSVIMYEHTEYRSESEIHKGIDENWIEPKEKATPELILKIQEGAVASVAIAINKEYFFDYF